VVEGTVIVESLRAGTDLRDINITIRNIRRVPVTGVTDEQPAVWSLLDFTVSDDAVSALIAALSAALLERGWYTDLRSDAETFVVFPGRVFRYDRGDHLARARARKFGASLRIPEAQLDWPV
jgi:hypothetical protein